MVTPSDHRAAWLARYVMPHELTMRQRLRSYRFPGLDIDDVVQEMYAILAALDSVDHIRDPRQYAYRTACSIILSQMKRNRTVSIIPVADIKDLAGKSDEPSPEAIVSDRERLRDVENALKQLPLRVYDVFMLRRIEGLSQREAAQRLGITENIVEKCMVQALQLLVIALRNNGKVSAGYPHRDSTTSNDASTNSLTNVRKIDSDDAT